MYGGKNEIIDLLRSQAPTLGVELDFQIGRIILQGSSADIAWALPHVRALAEILQPELQRSVTEIQKQFAAQMENLPPAPVPQSLLELQRSHFQCTESFVQVIPGRCWVVPGVLTALECEDWICRAQTHGLEPSKTLAARHNSRTSDFIDLYMAQL